MRRIAQGIAAGALVVWLIGSFLPFLNLGVNGEGPSFWEATGTEDVLLAFVAGIAIVVLVIGVVMDLRWSAAVGVGASAFIAGQLTPTEAPTLQGFDYGFWVMEIAAFAALGLCLLAAVWPEESADPAPAAAAPAPTPTEPVTTAMPALPNEPGWYPDPQGGTGLRLWSGTRWTDETRGA